MRGCASSSSSSSSSQAPGRGFESASANKTQRFFNFSIIDDRAGRVDCASSSQAPGRGFESRGGIRIVVSTPRCGRGNLGSNPRSHIELFVLRRLQLAGQALAPFCLRWRVWRRLRRLRRLRVWRRLRAGGGCSGVVSWPVPRSGWAAALGLSPAGGRHGATGGRA